MPKTTNDIHTPYGSKENEESEYDRSVYVHNKKVDQAAQNHDAIAPTMKSQSQVTHSTGRSRPITDNAHHKTGVTPQTLSKLLRQNSCNAQKISAKSSTKTTSYSEKNNTHGKPRYSRQLILKSSSKIFIGSLFIFSMALHFLFMEGVYKLSANEHQTQIKKQTPKTIEMAKPPEIPKKIDKIKDQKKTEPETYSNPVKQPLQDTPVHQKTVIQKLNVKQPSVAELEKEGMKLLDKAHSGSFPAIVFSYQNPSLFVQQMYRIGCKTILFDTRNKEYSDINLFDGNTLPISRSEFSGYSQMKRVIEDSQWNSIKSEAARRLSIDANQIEILLLVPTSLEAQWLGHLSFIFEQMKMKVSDVITADVTFQNAKLFLKQLHLKDGTSRQVSRQDGV